MGNVNTAMGFEQAAALMNSIVQQATGKTSIAATSTAAFISQAQTAMLTGYDSVIGAINQVLSKTIFSVRPYNAKFRGLQRDAVQWGNHVRKINFGSDGVEDDSRRPLVDGQSVDQQTVKKPVILQTNFFSFDTYQNHYTLFRDQLDTAFSGPDEFMRFVSGVTLEVSNKLEQYRENFARVTLANLIGATINATRVRHLVTEYANLMGIAAADKDTVLTTHIEGFCKWLFAELKTLSDRFTERSLLYQSAITGKDIYRHTPKEYQRLYIYSPFMAKVDAQVLASVFNPQYLTMGDREEVSYWQSIETPDTISVTPSQINAAGEYTQGSAVVASPVLGILMDYEAAGVTQVNEWSAPSPFNARGGYTNVWYHMDMRGWNDLTEKAVVLLLD